MIFIPLLNYSIENTTLFLYFLFMINELTAQAFFNLITNLSNEGLTDSAISADSDLNPDKWRETFSQAPQKLLDVHNKVWSEKPELLEDVIKLDPKYVVGLIEAEGCFSVFLGTSGKQTEKSFKIFEEFTLALDPIDAQIVKSLRAFFGVGVIKYRKDAIVYTVDSSWQLNYAIVPFLEQHSLVGLKRRDFLILKEVVYLKTETTLIRSPKTRNQVKYWIARYVYMFAEEIAQTRERTHSLEQIRQTLRVNDTGLPIEFFSNVILWLFLCSLTKHVKPSPWYVTGFCEGDGGSVTSVLPNKRVNTYNIGALQKGILEMIKAYFVGCGTIYYIDLTNQNENAKEHWRLLINRREELRFVHETHFKSFPLLGEQNKKKHYDCLISLLDAVERGDHLDRSKREKLASMCYGINLGGKRRKTMLEPLDLDDNN